MSSILNQSVTPSGWPPVLPATKAKGSTIPQDVSQNLPVAVPLPGLNSFKSSLKPNYSTSSAAAGGPSSWLYRENDLGISKESNGVFDNISSLSHHHLQHNLLGSKAGHAHVHESAAPNFFRSLLSSSNNKLNPMRDVMGELELFSSEPSVTLSVTVSSAVKLEQRQIDQIKKKMQRLTGFTNLKLENTVDPSLIAGFVIRYDRDDAHVIDLSVKGQLAELAARIESSDQRIAEQEHNWSFPN